MNIIAWREGDEYYQLSYSQEANTALTAYSAEGKDDKMVSQSWGS